MPAVRSLVMATAMATTTLVQALHVNGSSITPCDSPIYCHGEILKQIELAQPFSDSKTFVDLPTKKPLDEVVAAFDKLERPLSNNSALHDFLSTYFAEAGTELQSLDSDDLTTDPVFLDKLDDTVIKQFVRKVINIWPDLTRKYVGAENCDDCAGSFIPIERPFVVAGGRFREAYYWDSFWIIEGLLRTGGSFVQISKNIIENFLDLVEQFGFVPNGSRVYYLNRSQPPLLTQMVKTYVEYTNDTSILERALPLLIKEHEFFMRNRTTEIQVGDKTYELARYNVLNTEPRPESFYEDYVTASNESYYSESGQIYPETKPLSDEEKATLYGNLASGAESGMDYTSRWISNPGDASRDVYFPLRSLNTANIVGVDLNSILYANEMAIADFLADAGKPARAEEFRCLASSRSEAMYALMWNSTHHGYFDYNLTSSTQNLWVPLDSEDNATTSTQSASEHGAPEGYKLFLHAAQFYPFWTGAAPSSLKENPSAVSRAYSRVATALADQPGALAATNFASGQQWDRPNVWPPLVYALISGLRNVPATFGKSDPAWKDTQSLARQLAQKYLDSTFCTWRATGGSTSETPKLPGVPEGQNGIMFEKYADDAINVAGGGGEYEVVEGFGWSNGVLIWVADVFAGELERPTCTFGGSDGDDVEEKKRRTKTTRSAVELHTADARWIKKFHGGEI